MLIGSSLARVYVPGQFKPGTEVELSNRTYIVNYHGGLVRKDNFSGKLYEQSTF